MKQKRKAIQTRKRHKKRLLLVQRLRNNRDEAGRNKYRQDALLMACVHNNAFAQMVYG